MRLAHWTIVVCLIVIIAGCAQQPGDYMDTELRARVEALKTAAAAEPTTTENLDERVGVFWDWANAYALTGGPLPVNVPTAVGRPADFVASFDGFIQELSPQG